MNSWGFVILNKKLMAKSKIILNENLYNSACDYIEYYWGWSGRPPGFDGWFKDHQNLAEEEAKEIWKKAMQKISTYFI